MAERENYFLHYNGIRRCGFLWLRKKPYWQVRRWVQDTSSMCGPGLYYAEVVATYTNRAMAQDELELFKGNLPA